MATATPPTVVLIPFCVSGHLTSILEVGKRMLRSGGTDRAVSLTVLLAQLPAAQRAPDLDDAIRREAEDAESAGYDVRFHCLPAEKLPEFRGGEDFISRFMQQHASHAREAIAGLESPVAAVVLDFFCTTLLDVTRELGLPGYVYFTSAASMLALMLRLPALDREVAVDFEEMEGAVDLPGLPPVPAALLPAPMMKKDHNYTWLVYHGDRFLEAAGIIVNTVAELEPGVLEAIADGRCVPGRRVPAIYTVGPVMSSLKPPPEKPHECVQWLDAQPRASVVLLCFGSMGSFAPPQVLEIASGLERSGHRFLWVLRGRPPAHSAYPTDANVEELLPEGFLERTKERGLVWSKWAPQKEILAHRAVGGFVTHCGWNSTLEALWHGVPLVPWPLYAEQHLNAFELVAVMGVAVAMEVDRKRDNFVEVAELERAVRCLMDDGSELGRKAREKTTEAKAACRNAVEEDGSSYMALQKLTKQMAYPRGYENF
ncbi:anthocyanidin 3-O-glucosyltransferase 2-like [Oryza brachyantha]|uniref:anthocyanidin 3-O-glucosyltransferase 2-like n=1 Tax=Oryza brachyantha TaxID=4533 RepID=UPI001ADACAAF|nr:anthocyanidin 3-O-glucosyltransferase 2-like [Oryza brachyantha]